MKRILITTGVIVVLFILFQSLSNYISGQKEYKVRKKQITDNEVLLSEFISEGKKSLEGLFNGVSFFGTRSMYDLHFDNMPAMATDNKVEILKSDNYFLESWTIEISQSYIYMNIHFNGNTELVSFKINDITYDPLTHMPGFAINFNLTSEDYIARENNLSECEFRLFYNGSDIEHGRKVDEFSHGVLNFTQYNANAYFKGELAKHIRWTYYIFFENLKHGQDDHLLLYPESD